MRKIIFLPKVLAARYVPGQDAALISISDDCAPSVTLHSGWRDVLYQKFHDADRPSEGIEIFKETHAQAILEFAEKHKNSPELVIHCTMGQSRSAAVALYLSEKYNHPCFKIGQRVDYRSLSVYNRHVYRTLLNVDCQFKVS